MTESNSRKIDISLPYTGEDEWLALRESVISGWLTQGPKVKEFENLFSKIHQVNHSIATSNCTTALHLILVALGIGPGDEVILPAFTWVATANVVEYCGAKPVLVDVDRVTNNIDPLCLAKAITNKTKAIIVVHLFGLPVDMDKISEIANGIPIVEDAACAVGASYKDKMAGTFGVAGAFSFHPRKSITTGEGGMITTNSQSLADKVDKLRNHGAEVSEEQRHSGPRPYLLPEFNVLGFNYRMTDMQGAVGVTQLKKLDKIIEARSKSAAYYNSELKEIDWIRVPTHENTVRHAWQAYVLYLDPQKVPFTRNEIMDKLQKDGISTRPGTHAVHMLGYYKEKYGFKDSDFPGAYDCNENTMAIPLHNKMKSEDYIYVVNAIKKLNKKV